MKLRLYLPLLLFCCISVLQGQNVSFSDYMVPISKAATMRFDGNWNYAQTGESVQSNTATGTLNYATFYNSPPLAWSFNLNATASKSLQQNLAHTVGLEARFLKYVWEDNKWFGFSKYSAQSLTVYSQVAQDITVGAGYGRYINATALAKAVRIENHFLEAKVITDRLPKDVMLRIAAIIERQNEYQTIYGTTYETIWLRDIEREVQVSGVCSEDGVGSIGILRMRQVLFGINERVNERDYGWDIEAGFLFPLTTFNKAPVGNPNLDLTVHFSVPMSWSTQVNSVLDISSPMDSSFFNNFLGKWNADFIFELNSRVNLVSGYSVSVIKAPNQSAIVSNSLTLSFWYYIENSIFYTINGTLSKDSGKPRQLTMTMGLQYNFY